VSAPRLSPDGPFAPGAPARLPNAFWYAAEHLQPYDLIGPWGGGGDVGVPTQGSAVRARLHPTRLLPIPFLPSPPPFVMPPPGGAGGLRRPRGSDAPRQPPEGRQHLAPRCALPSAPGERCTDHPPDPRDHPFSESHSASTPLTPVTLPGILIGPFLLKFCQSVPIFAPSTFLQHVSQFSFPYT